MTQPLGKAPDMAVYCQLRQAEIDPKQMNKAMLASVINT